MGKTIRKQPISKIKRESNGEWDEYYLTATAEYFYGTKKSSDKRRRANREIKGDEYSGLWFEDRDKYIMLISGTDL